MGMGRSGAPRLGQAPTQQERRSVCILHCQDLPKVDQPRGSGTGVKARLVRPGQEEDRLAPEPTRLKASAGHQKGGVHASDREWDLPGALADQDESRKGHACLHC